MSNPHDRSAFFATPISRRAMLRAASALTVAVSPALRARAAFAAGHGNQLTMPNSGGSFLDAVQSAMVEPFSKKFGAQMTQVSGNMAAHTLAIRNNRNDPPFDVYLGFGDDFLGLMRDGYLLPIAGKVPSLRDVLPKFKDQWKGYGAYIDYSSVGISYSTDAIKRPPKSWREFIDRTASGEFGNSVFFPNMPSATRGPEVMMVIASALGGDYHNMDASFAAVKRIKPHIVKFITSLNDPVTLLESKEGTIGTGWDGRTFVAHDAGAKVAWVRPREGAATSGPILGVVKNGNTDLAFKFVDYALSVEGQTPFVEATFYGSVNGKVKYSSRLAGRIPKPNEVVIADEAFIAANKAAWFDRWNREIAS